LQIYHKPLKLTPRVNWCGAMESIKFDKIILTFFQLESVTKCLGVRTNWFPLLDKANKFLCQNSEKFSVTKWLEKSMYPTPKGKGTQWSDPSQWRLVGPAAIRAHWSGSLSLGSLSKGIFNAIIKRTGGLCKPYWGFSNFFNEYNKITATNEKLVAESGVCILWDMGYMTCTEL